MAYDPFDAIDGLFASMIVQDTQLAQAANSALNSALGFYTKKDYGRAASEFKRVIGLDPQSTKAYNFLANSYQFQKKDQEAIKAYKTSLSIDPTQDDVHTKLGNIYLARKEYNKAEKEFKEAIKLNPGDTLAPYTLGQMYQQQERYGEAEAMFKKVIRMAPNDPNPYYALGTAYNKQGKFEDAAKQLTQAVKLRPKMAPAHLELGTAYAGLGDTTKANREVEILTKLDAAQGALLKASIAKPRITVAVDTRFTSSLGPNTPLFALDVSLIEPGKSQEFSMSFYFDREMDAKSIQDTQNWTLSKAAGGAAGYYNNTLPVAPTEAYIPQNPTRVTYDPENRMATVTFMLSQNSAGNATIDPSHMVFKFSGKDVKGNTMDPKADQYDGYSQTPF